MKFLSVARKYGARVAVGASAMIGSVAAFADAAAASASLSGVSTDVETLGWAGIGLLIVAAGFKYMRRAI